MGKYSFPSIADAADSDISTQHHLGSRGWLFTRDNRTYPYYRWVVFLGLESQICGKCGFGRAPRAGRCRC